MSMKLRLSILVGMLALASAPLTGCGGTECGSGTVEQDGQCVADGELVTDDVCAEGTVLVDGACVIDDAGCGENTQLNPDTGTCEQVPGFCAEGTTWDSGAEECVANTDIACGEGTQADNGTCVPALDQICGDKTAANDDGRCVIQADACATGEVLDPNTGDCVATDTYCSANTAFDSDSGTCVPTADVCDTGTKFDSDSGLCLPDACQTGDVLLNGVCVSPAEELAANADLTETEPNDPTMGGTAEALTVKAVGETTVFTGTIDAPSDLDGDGTVDQDVDSFTFDATAGQWFQIAAQSTGLPAPGFMVEGPNGYTRYSPVDLSADAARQVAIPYDGTYTITVLPALVMNSDVGPSGNADWGWVGSLEQIAAPSAPNLDFSAAGMSGSYDMLTDNLFNITGVSAGDILELSVDESGADAEGMLQVWSSATTFEYGVDISSGDTVEVVVPASGTLMLLADWMTISGPELGFDISGSVDADSEYIGPIGDDSSVTSTAVPVNGGDSFKYVFNVNPGQVIEFSFDNAESEEVEFWLRNGSGTLLLTDDWVDAVSDTADTDYNYWYTHNGGTFVLEVTPNSSSDDLTDVEAIINTITPNDLGTVAAGDTVTANSATQIDEDRWGFHLFTTNDSLIVSGDVTTPADEDADAYLYDQDFNELDSFTSSGSVTISDTILRAGAGVYLVGVQADEDIPSHDLSLSFTAAPLLEQEPNDTDAQANPFDITKDLLGMTSDVNEIDTFTFTVPNDLAADEVFIAELVTQTSGSDTYRCEIRDSSGTVVGASDADGDEDGCIAMATGLLASETYYLEIERMEYSDDDDYLISARTETGWLEVEPNDTDTNATSFVLDDMVAGGSLFGTLPLDTDTDYFSFTLASDRPANEVLTFSGQAISAEPTSSMDWRLLDGSLTELATGALDEDLTGTGLTAGTYYIELTRSSSTDTDGGDYQLAVTSEVPVCGNSTIEAGETCDDGNTTGGDGCSATCAFETAATNSTPATIDGTTPTATRVATVSGCNTTVSDVTVDLDITHTWRGDLVVELTDPDGTTVRLHDNTGSSSDDIIGTYPTTLTVDGPGTLADFNGGVGNGDWTLSVEDTATFSDDGTFNSFTVKVWCN